MDLPTGKFKSAGHRIMDSECDACHGAGRLHDGSVCPRCDRTRWQGAGEVEIARPKRQAWIRADDSAPKVITPVKTRASG